MTTERSRAMGFFDEYPELVDYDKKQWKSHLVKKENHIVTLTFNRPETRNASGDTWEVMRILECIKADTDARAWVLTGVGAAFHAGANIKGWQWLMEGHGIWADAVDIPWLWT